MFGQLSKEEYNKLGISYESDEQFYESLFKTLYPMMVTAAGRIVDSRPAAEDIAQDAFIELWDLRNKDKIKTSLKAYIYRMVINRAINHKKRASKGGSLEELENKPEIVSTDMVNEDIEASDLNSLIQIAIRQLPEGCRKIFLQSRFDQLSQKEIAEVNKISVKTVSAQLLKAVKHIKGYLEENSKDINTLILLGLGSII